MISRDILIDQSQAPKNFRAENKQVVVQNEGRVRISPQTRNDVVWLAQEQLGELPNVLSEFKIANQQNQDIRKDFWKKFPNTFDCELTFVDNRTNIETPYEKIQKLIRNGLLSAYDPSMRCRGENIEDIALTQIEIFTRPYFTNQNTKIHKFSTRETTRTIASMEHEFGHAIQNVVADAIRKSEQLTPLENYWHHLWVMPDFLLEGYAMSHESADPILVKGQLIFQNLLDKATRLINYNQKQPTLGSHELLEQQLQSWNTNGLFFSESYQFQQQQILSLTLYLSLLGNRVGMDPQALFHMVTEKSSLEIAEEDMNRLSIRERASLLKKVNLPTILKIEAHRVEFETQLFYYKQYKEMEKIARIEHQQSIEKKISDDFEKVFLFNQNLTHYLLQQPDSTDKARMQNFVDYNNELMSLLWKWGSMFPERNLSKEPKLLSVYSRKKENPYYPILARKFHLDL